MVLLAGTRRIPILWPEPPKVKKGDLPQFCPKEHRSFIVERFRCHACQHPLIPLNDDDHTCFDKDEIYESAVFDMYTYCRSNGLSQVWAYLWNCWYCPEKWPLWARSAAQDISVLRTTMVVEGFWNKLKHTTLGPFNRPRLDLVVHLILTQILPDVVSRLELHLDRRRQGRPKQLAAWQRDFKTEWEDLSKSDNQRRREHEEAIHQMTKKSVAWRQERLSQIREAFSSEPGTYRTCIVDWTCSCPSYLVSRFLLCKHLVREANALLAANDARLSLRSFYDLRRERSIPFYRIPGVNQDLSSASSDEGISIPSHDDLEGPVDESDLGDQAPILMDEVNQATSLLRDIAIVDGLNRVRFSLLIL